MEKEGASQQFIIKNIQESFPILTEEWYFSHMKHVMFPKILIPFKDFCSLHMLFCFCL